MESDGPVAWLVYSPEQVAALDELIVEGEKVLACHPETQRACTERGLEVMELHDLLANDEPRDEFNSVKDAAISLVTSMDRENASELDAAHAGWGELQWFTSQYSVMAIMAYTGFSLFDRALSRAIDRWKLVKIRTFLDCPLKHGLTSDENIQALVSDICTAKGVRVEFTKMCDSEVETNSRKSRSEVTVWQWLQALPNRARGWYQKSVLPLMRKCPQVLLFEPLYDGKDFARRIPRSVVWPRRSNGGLLFLARRTPIPRVSFAKLPRTALEGMRHGRILEDALLVAMKGAYRKIADRLLATEKLLTRARVAVAVWDCPPYAVPGLPMQIRMIRGRGISVVGMQHGGCYGLSQLKVQHMLGDYCHCDHFFSWLKHDVDEEACSPNMMKPGQIVVTGSLAERERPRRVSQQSNSMRVDLLYAINYRQMMLGGHARLPISELHRRQVQILAKLQQITDLKVVVQTPPNAGWKNVSTINFLNSYPELRIERELRFIDALASFRPRAVILDQFSTPFNECMSEDCEILTLYDPAGSMNDAECRRYSRRAYLTSDVQELLGWLNDFAMGRLQPRRSNVLGEGTTLVDPATCILDLVRLSNKESHD